MRLRIAGLTIAVSSNDPAITPSVDAPSAAFLVNGDGPADVDVAVERVAVMPAPSGTPVFDSGPPRGCAAGVNRLSSSARSSPPAGVWRRPAVWEGGGEPLQYPLDELIV